jgi:hypothetical protein
MKEVSVSSRKRIRTAIFFVIATGWLLTMLNVNIVFADQSKSKTKTATVRMGTLKQAGSEFVIRSGRTTYRISGQDFSPWVGKKVKVTGTMSGKEKHKVLEVNKIEDVKSNR